MVFPLPTPPRFSQPPSSMVFFISLENSQTRILKKKNNEEVQETYTQHIQREREDP